MDRDSCRSCGGGRVADRSDWAQLARESDMADDKAGKFTGVDRRKGERRKKKDRRDMLRFELEKEPRRKGKDRRKNSPWDGRHDS